MQDSNGDDVVWVLRHLTGRRYSVATIIDFLLRRCGDDEEAKLMLLCWFKHNNWRLSLDPLPVNVPSAVGLAYRAAVDERGSVKAAIAALRAEAVRCVKAN
jgi:hypothetical protein